jgi:N-acyl-L-homoserine lactone synthetase
METSRAAVGDRDGEGRDVVLDLFKGYRFRLCETPEMLCQALDIRRRVYLAGSGYSVPIPDEYDSRSWLLLAEDVERGIPVGSLRMTPRFAGPLEAEEYFILPRQLAAPRSVELTRFAILPEYRKGKTFLPIVSLGLFKLVSQLLLRINARHMIVCSKPERVWTYQWLRFKRTGLFARYKKLEGAEHELLACDFPWELKHLDDHPFRDFFRQLHYREVIIPRRLPSLRLVDEERPSVLANIA